MRGESASSRGNPDCGWTRRAILATGGASLLAGFAGCQRLPANDVDGVTLESSLCPAGASAESPLERWLLPVSRAEFPEPILWYTSLETSLVRRYPSSFGAYLAPIEAVINRIGISTWDIDRSYALNPPVEDYPGLLVLETALHPEDIVRRIRMEDRFFTADEEYKGYDVYTSRTPYISVFALGDGRMIIAPSEGGGDIPLGSRERIERLIDVQHEEHAPYTCFHSPLDAILDRVEETTLVNVIFRTDESTFDSGQSYVPAGAVAGAYSVTIDVPEGYFEEERDDGYPIRLEYTAVFPEGEGAADAVREYVRENRMHDRMIGDIPIVTFVDPTVERSGRAVTVRETITFE